MELLAQAAQAQAEAAEAVGEAWDEIAEMEEELARELGIPVDELEAYLDGAGALGGEIDLDGDGQDEEDASLEEQVERLKSGGGATPEDLPYDIV